MELCVASSPFKGWQRLNLDCPRGMPRLKQPTFPFLLYPCMHSRAFFALDYHEGAHAVNTPGTQLLRLHVRHCPHFCRPSITSKHCTQIKDPRPPSQAYAATTPGTQLLRLHMQRCPGLPPRPP
eukprot:1147287-Pelagomonas_calceolata.AAC.9